MAQEPRHHMQESDIGSGEKTPAQKDIEREISDLEVAGEPDRGPRTQGGNGVEERGTVGTISGDALDGSHLHQGVEEQQRVWEKQDPAEMRQTPSGMTDMSETMNTPPSRILRNGEQIARITAAPLPDGTYEAQVFVRLAREPELAETYIPAGTFPDENQAWAAAEGRARRAFEEDEIQ